MDKPTIDQRIRRILDDHVTLSVVELTPGTNIADLRMDSLDQVEFIMSLESEFLNEGLQIGDHDYEKFVTYADILKFVTDKVAK